MTSLAPSRSVSSTGGPVVTRTADDLAAALGRSGGSRRTNARTALVPTMGALHAGHAALLDQARDRGDLLVASIFVNPLQFGAGEDLDRYPRTFDDDLQLCAANGVDMVFAPTVDTMYPGGRPQVTVQPGPLAETLDGTSRPGHFGGVLTVVAKLFGLVRPDVAVFGHKDYQQLVLIRRMVTDLCMPVDVVGVETVREADGLALSSRNAYLSAEERRAALALSRALRAGSAAGPAGVDGVLGAARDVLAGEPSLAVDYLALRGVDLDEPPASGEARLLVAATAGTTRLIDNLPVLLRHGTNEGTPQ
ncbi:MAG: pantoate--beta-alanine ligase [Nocardioidaceae bacterium]|nr:pantoate--beta-alanine ligase [Nocardioidaceae bacterium]